MILPSDDFILLSMVNMKLRDGYASLEDFCLAEGADKETIVSRLSALGYEYDEQTNSFR